MTDAARLRYLSVCSGIEAATVAWHPLGWEPAAFSEIEAFPRAVLTHHYPTVPLHGDFTTIEGHEYGAIDVLVGGTPCQDFSVAGLRAGIAGDRGNLTLEFLRLAARTKPRWIVWENVPGVLSSDDGRALGAFLGGLAELGYGFGYRVLDAQYFNLAQRRARIFVVGYLGDWRRAAAVLFERESLLWDSPPSRETGERVALTISARTKGGGGLGTDFDCDGGLIASPIVMASGQSNAPIFDNNQCPALTCLHEAPIVAHSLRVEGFDAGEDGTGRGTPIVTAFYPTNRQPKFGNYEDVSPSIKIGSSGSSGNPPAIAFSAKDHGADAGPISLTLRAGGHDRSHANGGVMPAVAFSIMPMNSGKNYKARETDVAQPIMAGGPVGGNQGGDVIAQPLPFDTTQITSKANYSNPQPGDPSHPLAAGAHAPAVAYTTKLHNTQSNNAGKIFEERTTALDANTPPPALLTAMAVRRLTVRECERLQGFPDDYTFVPYRGKPAADGPRYKALGNSMAVPCMRWLGERIQMVEALT